MFDKFNDECAIFGLSGHTEASNLAYLGLYAMRTAEGKRRHRASDGIA